MNRPRGEADPALPLEVGNGPGTVGIHREGAGKSPFLMGFHGGLMGFYNVFMEFYNDFMGFLMGTSITMVYG